MDERRSRGSDGESGVPGDEGRAALTDPETRLPNRLHFDVVYRVAFTAGTRGLPISVLLLEVEALASADVDEVRDLVRRLASVTRRMDLLARLDTIRLGVLLLDSNVHGGRLAAERMIGTIAPWLRDRGAHAKVGIAGFVEGMEEEGELMASAQAALADARDAPGDGLETRP